MRRFVKQYGERRTGTNLLRLLLTSQFSRLEVLMHTLGHKHRPAPDDSELRAAAKAGGQWLVEMNRRQRRRRGEHCAAQREAYLAGIEPELKRALLAKQLLYLISIKDPYAWAGSRLKQWGWRPATHSGAVESHFLARLEPALDTFNSNYANWLALARRHRDRSQVIPYEALLQGRGEVMRDLALRFGFCPVATADAAVVEGIVLPTEWDNCITRAHFEPFDSSFYTERRYMQQLTPAMIRLVRRKIDWKLLAPLGYAPESPWQFPALQAQKRAAKQPEYE